MKNRVAALWQHLIHLVRRRCEQEVLQSHHVLLLHQREQVGRIFLFAFVRGLGRLLDLDWLCWDASANGEANFQRP